VIVNIENAFSVLNLYHQWRLEAKLVFDIASTTYKVLTQNRRKEKFPTRNKICDYKYIKRIQIHSANSSYHILHWREKKDGWEKQGKQQQQVVFAGNDSTGHRWIQRNRVTLVPSSSSSTFLHFICNILVISTKANMVVSMNYSN